MEKAVFVGHSIAGDELRYLGANNGDRVAKLLYLDAYDYGTYNEILGSIPDDFFAPGIKMSRRDSLSVGHYSAYSARRKSGVPISELCATIDFDSTGQFIGYKRASGAFNRVVEGVHSASFDQIDIPVLGVFTGYDPLGDVSERLATATLERQRDLLHFSRKWRMESDEQLVRFQEEIPNSRLVVLKNANHHVWWSHPAETVALMLEFLAE